MLESFFNKASEWRPVENCRMFSYKFCEVLDNIYFVKRMWTAVNICEQRKLKVAIIETNAVNHRLSAQGLPNTL